MVRPTKKATDTYPPREMGRTLNTTKAEQNNLNTSYRVLEKKIIGLSCQCGYREQANRLRHAAAIDRTARKFAGAARHTVISRDSRVFHRCIAIRPALVGELANAVPVPATL